MRALLVIPLLLASAVRGEIIDRIAVTVSGRVITESMVTQQIRLAAFQDGRVPEFSPANKRRAAETLVSRLLLLQEMDDSRYPEPAMADIGVQVEKLIVERFKTPEAYAAALTAQRIEAPEFLRFLQQQQRAYSFTDVRFRTGVEVTPEELAAYHEKEFKADWQSRNPNTPLPPLDDVIVEIEQVLMERKLDQATEEWLKRTQASADIRYREEAFQ